MFCVSCGTANDDNNFRCVQCGSVLQRPIGHGGPPTGAASAGNDAALALLVPVGRSGLSIAASYLGLFAFVFFPAAPFALLLGILALRDLRRHPEKKGRGRAIFAIVVGGLMTLLGAVVVLAIALG